MQVSGHIVISLERKGADGVTLNISGEQVIFAAGEYFKYVTIEAFRGADRIALTADNITIEGTIANVWRGATAADGIITVTVERMQEVEVSGTFTYILMIDGTAYTRYINVQTVLNGADGSEGKDGADAVLYRIAPSTNNLVYWSARGSFTPTTLTFTAYKTDGGDTSEYGEGYWRIQAKYNATDDWQNVKTTSDPSATCDVAMNSDFPELPITVKASLHSGTPSDSNQIEGCEYSLSPTTQTVLRSLFWDDCADLFPFESGGLGDMYTDIVYHTVDGVTNCYLCISNHNKSTRTEPGVGSGWQNVWAQAEKYSIIATSILLADIAKINNLYVDDVYMEESGEDAQTAIWINPAIGGMKINRLKNLTATGRANQTAADWENPTTQFHAGRLPSVDEIYGDSGDESGGGSTGTAWESTTVDEASYTNSGNDAAQSGVQHARVSLCTVASGDSILVNVAEFTASLVEGESEGGIALSYSTAMIEVKIVVGSISQTVGSVRVSGDGVNADRFTETFIAQQVTVKNTGTLEQTAYIYLYRTCELRHSATITTSAFTVRYRTMSESGGSGSETVNNYVSNFSAEGVFIGNNSGNYFRLAVADSITNILLRSNNNGLSLTSDGLLQQVNGGNSPVGSTLMAAYMKVSGGGLSANIWTWDGNMPTLTYQQAGCYRLDYPSEWYQKMGTRFLEGTLAVTATAFSESNELRNVYVTSFGDAGVYRGCTELKVTDLNGSYVDATIMVRVDFVGNGQMVFSD